MILSLATLTGIYLHKINFFQKQPEKGLTKVSLRLPIPVADTGFAPYYLAVDKGIFRNNGLEVIIQPGTPDLSPVKMVSQNIDQFGIIGGPELLLSARAKGAPIIGIALIHRDSDFVVLLTKSDSGITKVQQLQNKKVGFFFGHISTDVLRMLFKKEDVKVEEVDVGFDYGPFLAGKLDAQWAFRTTAGITLPEKGIKINMISPADYGITTQGHVLITNERMIQEQSKTVEKFTHAIQAALLYTIAHPEEAIVATVKRDPKFNKTVGQKQLQIYNAAITRNHPPGWISKKLMESTKEQMVKVGLIPSSFNISDSYTNRFLNE